MALYTIIYNWYLTLFGTELDGFSSMVMGSSINLKEWICHTGTIITLVVFAIFLFLCVRYLFKLFANCFVR